MPLPLQFCQPNVVNGIRSPMGHLLFLQSVLLLFLSLFLFRTVLQLQHAEEDQSLRLSLSERGGPVGC